jgi:hypothetical protein
MDILDTTGKPIKIGSWYKINVLRIPTYTEDQYEAEVKYFGKNVAGYITNITFTKKGYLFEYSDGVQTKLYNRPCTFTPINSALFRKLSLSYSYQGSEGSCFAHAASLMIFHNLYGITLHQEDKLLYIENNCNLHLNTTRQVEDYQVLLTQCGKSGAARILLFLYIYKVITNKFGCNGGDYVRSVLYYLNTPFHPIFNKDINLILMPIYKSVDKELYDFSILDMSEYTSDYNDYLSYYFDDYYGGINTVQPDHAVTLVGINKFGILCKDSATVSAFIIPFQEFRADGTFLINKTRFNGIQYLFFLYKRTNTGKYPVYFKNKLNENLLLLDGDPILKADIEEEYKSEREVATDRRKNRMRQEARLEKIVSDSLKQKNAMKRWFGGKRTRRVKYGRSYSANDEKV